MRRFFYDNGLSIVLFTMFFFSLVGQYVTGWKEYNEDLEAHRQRPSIWSNISAKDHFIEAVFENWESEFLQMGMMVVLSSFLRQKGSPESKAVDAPYSETGA